MSRISGGLRRSLLAAELRRLRAEARLNGPAIAKELGWSPAKFSRLESGITRPSTEDVAALLARYEVPEGRREGFLELARQAAQPGWWDSYAKDLPSSYVDYIAFEHEASVIINWEPGIIPGLLQTADYIEAFIRLNQDYFDMSPSLLRSRLQARLKRQELLTAAQPLQLRAIVDEAVVYRLIGDKEIMRAQLEHLIKVAQLPNVTIRIVELARPYPLLTSSLSQLQFEPTAHPVGFRHSDITYMETATGGEISFDERETHQYGRMVDRIMQAALKPDESIQLMRRAVGRLA
ncbi:helix-turn-helix transcriptional regulator [Nonomuraea sp. NPDC050643]|uniref:helix-turn-helix domain-containing protein n=1 Tax=Nonomuraea sp. NPDC050643 TaxID=3155660 RepID=UPI0033D196B0